MKSFRAETQEPLRTLGIKDYHMSRHPTVAIRYRDAVLEPRATHRKPRVLQ